MKIKSLKIDNFRCYQNEICINFDNMTAIIGKNDAGKSTILEALDIFFHDGKGLAKLDKDDINKIRKQKGDNDIKIAICFTDLPTSVIIDETNSTTLKDEYLLNEQGELEVIKTFKGGGTTATSIKVAIKAFHPTNKQCAGLLLKKQADLISIVEKLNVECSDKRKNSLLRASVWNSFSYEELDLKEVELDVNSKDGDLKALWNKLQNYMPCYSLFQVDRKNTDNDSEIQDPLKEAVKQIINDSELQERLDYVANKVRERLQEVSDLTLAKIKEMNEDIADSLHPRVPTTQELKWGDVFKNLSITGDEDIPINKRGSGVKRLILLNFFRAEAERRQKDSNSQHIIYAIEEPETSQHKNHQKLLIDALKNLSKNKNTQVIITTHSGDIVKQLDFNQLRVIYEENGFKKIRNVEKSSLPYPSLNEVNYLAFGDVSEEYHNELYGFLQAKAIDEDPDNGKEKYFEKWLESKGCSKRKNWIREVRGVAQSPYQCTIETFIRNFIHHPENSNNPSYSIQELTDSIHEMKSIAVSLLD